MVPSPIPYCSQYDRPINQEMSWWVKESWLYWKTSRLRRWWTCVPKNHLTQVRTRACFILRGEGVWLVVAKPLGVGILCSCICPHSSDHNVPVNFQLAKCYSLFCNFLFLCEWKCYTVKDESLENGLSCLFQATGIILIAKEIEYKG